MRASAVRPGSSEFLCKSEPKSLEIRPPSIRISRARDSSGSFFIERGIGILDSSYRQDVSEKFGVCICNRCE